MFDEFAPNVQKIALSPRTPVRMHGVQSIGYFMGDIPAVVVYVGSERYQLKMGQCIPVVDRDISIENPYSRSAQVQISVNAAPQFQPSPDVAEQLEYVTYRSFAIENWADNPFSAEPETNGIRGVAMIAKSGRYLVNFDCTMPVNVLRYRHTDVEGLATRPADFMPKDMEMVHMSVDSLSELISISGWYREPDFNTWMTGALGVVPDKKLLFKAAHSGRFLLEPNVAVTFRTVLGDEADFNFNTEVLELANLDGPRHG